MFKTLKLLLKKQQKSTDRLTKTTLTSEFGADCKRRTNESNVKENTMSFFGRKSPLEVLVMPAVCKYNQFRQRRREAQSKKVTERELTALHHKIVSRAFVYSLIRKFSVLYPIFYDLIILIICKRKCSNLKRKTTHETRPSHFAHQITANGCQ